MKRSTMAFAGFVLLAGCAEGGQETATKTYDVAEEAAPQAASGAAPASNAVALPQIAYSYRYRFRLATDAVPRAQDAHVRMCDQLGPARCRVVEMARSAADGDYVHGSLKLQVAAPIARAFGGRLVAAVAGEGGETVDRGITGEDLSKQIVDTAARIRIKEALVDRLTVLLQTRSGNIAQAVEAERAVNAAQEELEQARAWLTEMRGRVAMSNFEIGYASGAPLAGGRIGSAFDEVGELFGTSVALIVRLVAALAPWALLAGLAWWAGRVIRRRRARPDQDSAADDGISNTPS